MDYEDSPSFNIEKLKALHENELEAYVKGYLLAISHFKEALTAGKTELLEALFLITEERDKDQFMAHVALLDEYEHRMNRRKAHVKELFPRFFNKDTKIP